MTTRTVSLTDAARSRGQGYDKFRSMDDVVVSIDEIGNVRLSASRINAKDDDDVTQAFLSFPPADVAKILNAIADVAGATTVPTVTPIEVETDDENTAEVAPGIYLSIYINSIAP